MSALPMEAPLGARISEPDQRRHLDIVSTRLQKKARPRAVYALVTVGGLFAILIAQLLLSIVVSDGAYQISSLQQVQKQLFRDKQSLTEQLQVLKSPQHLAANAKALGMVTNSGTTYLRLSDGAVIGKPAPAAAVSETRTGVDETPLVPNQLLDGVSLTPVSSVDASTSVTGGPDAAGTPASGTSNKAGIPSPITR